MDDAWDIAEDRQKDVYPKLRADSDLQKHPQRREKNRGHEAPKIRPQLLSQDPTQDTLPTTYKPNLEGQSPRESPGPIRSLEQPQ